MRGSGESIHRCDKNGAKTLSVHHYYLLDTVSFRFNADARTFGLLKSRESEPVCAGSIIAEVNTCGCSQIEMTRW